MPRASVEGKSASKGGWSEEHWPTGLSLGQCGHVFGNPVRYISYRITLKCNHLLSSK